MNQVYQQVGAGDNPALMRVEQRHTLTEVHFRRWKEWKAEPGFDEIEDADDDHLPDIDWEQIEIEHAEPILKPAVFVSTDIKDMADQAIFALAGRDDNTFSRGGRLVTVVEGQPPPAGITRSPSAPSIVALSVAALRERLSEHAIWVQLKEGEEKPTLKLPPVHVTQAVRDRGVWDGIRPIEGSVGYPFVRTGGSIVTERGYDDRTGVYLSTDVEVAFVPPSATKEEATEAAEFVLDLVCDFPFENEAHKSAWLAALLTPLMRFAIDGPVPLFVFVANIRGAGKTLLADLIGTILTGLPMTHTTNTSDDEEMRKKLGAFFMAGDPLVLFDNAVGIVGTPSLDNVITSRVYKDRILGKTENTPAFENRTTFYVTGNNPVLREDTARRSIQIRLESDDDRPERRAEFRYNLPDDAASRRPALVAALLTILDAYEAAGRPRQGMIRMGSFEAWSRAVRAPLVWLGLDDPALTNNEAVDSASEELDLLIDLVDGWERVQSEFAEQRGGASSRLGVKASDVLGHLQNYSDARYRPLRDALIGLCRAPAGRLPDARAVGMVLRTNQGRWLPSDKRIVQDGTRAGSKYWRVEVRTR